MNLPGVVVRDAASCRGDQVEQVRDQRAVGQGEIAPEARQVDPLPGLHLLVRRGGGQLSLGRGEQLQLEHESIERTRPRLAPLDVERG